MFVLPLGLDTFAVSAAHGMRSLPRLRQTATGGPSSFLGGEVVVAGVSTDEAVEQPVQLRDLALPLLEQEAIDMGLLEALNLRDASADLLKQPVDLVLGFAGCH